MCVGLGFSIFIRLQSRDSRATAWEVENKKPAAMKRRAGFEIIFSVAYLPAEAGGVAGGVSDAGPGVGLRSITSISKISVEPGGMPGRPSSPYASCGGM